MKKIFLQFNFLLILIFACIGTSQADFSGKYCEMDGAYTSGGEYVYGEFYMDSDKYGEADGAYTDSGEYVYGECYRYSGRYCEMDGAYTESGDEVYGECYIY